MQIQRLLKFPNLWGMHVGSTKGLQRIQHGSELTALLRWPFRFRYFWDSCLIYVKKTIPLWFHPWQFEWYNSLKPTSVPDKSNTWTTSSFPHGIYILQRTPTWTTGKLLTCRTWSPAMFCRSFCKTVPGCCWVAWMLDPKRIKFFQHSGKHTSWIIRVIKVFEMAQGHQLDLAWKMPLMMHGNAGNGQGATLWGDQSAAHKWQHAMSPRCPTFWYKWFKTAVLACDSTSARSPITAICHVLSWPATNTPAVAQCVPCLQLWLEEWTWEGQAFSWSYWMEIHSANSDWGRNCLR